MVMHQAGEIFLQSQKRGSSETKYYVELIMHARCFEVEVGKLSLPYVQLGQGVSCLGLSDLGDLLISGLGVSRLRDCRDSLASPYRRLGLIHVDPAPKSYEVLVGKIEYLTVKAQNPNPVPYNDKITLRVVSLLGNPLYLGMFRNTRRGLLTTWFSRSYHML